MCTIQMPQCMSSIGVKPSQPSRRRFQERFARAPSIELSLLPLCFPTRRRLRASKRSCIRSLRKADAFLAEAQKSGSHIVVLDIPLLFETGLDRQVDAVVLVTAPETVQRERLRQRPGMTSEHLEVIVQRQMSDIEKRARAHFIIDSAHGFDSARRQVRGVLRALAGVKNNR